MSVHAEEGNMQPIDLEAVRKKLAFWVFPSSYTSENASIDRLLQQCKNYAEISQSFFAQE